MKMLKVAAMLLACAEGADLSVESHAHTHSHTHMHTHAHAHSHSHLQSRSKAYLNAIKSFELESKDHRLSQSFATAFQMAPPKLMTADGLPVADNDECPTPAKKLTHVGSGGAFLDGCYLNTSRKETREEMMGHEAQHYKYMWKHACSYTKWVPSNQFMYSDLSYDAKTMTLERFGFIGMEKKCFWGSIGIIWKRPLPVDQILPNNTLTVKGPYLLSVGQLVNVKSADGLCLSRKGNEIVIGDCAPDDSKNWQFWDNGELRYKPTGQCVTVAKQDNWTPILLAKCNGSIQQQWELKPTTNTQFQIVNKDYKKCLDMKGSKNALKGEKASLYYCTLNDNMEYVWKN